MENQYEVETIVGKRFHKNKIQYKVKWLNYNNRYNRWINVDDMNCEELIATYEQERAEEIVDAEKQNNEIQYTIRMKQCSKLETVMSSEVKEKWPKLVLQFLRNNIEMINDVGTSNENNSIPAITLSNQTMGDPIKVHYVTDVMGTFQYLLEWPRGEHKFVRASEAEMNWPNVIIDFLEENAAFEA